MEAQERQRLPDDLVRALAGAHEPEELDADAQLGLATDACYFSYLFRNT